MKAQLTDGTEITGKSLKDIETAMKQMLKVAGPRGLTAQVDNGATVHVELYEGQDWTRTANGRVIRK